MRELSGFRHEALLYAGDDGFLEGTLPFIGDAITSDEPTLVVVDEPKIRALREALGEAAVRVSFQDMSAIGTNPARIIPVWNDFVAAHAATGRPLRGIGEPVSAGRSTAAIAEAQRHEALLNLAFAQAPALRMLCAYATDQLDAAVVDEAFRSHPHVVEAGVRAPSPWYRDGIAGAEFDGPLPEPEVSWQQIAFEGRQLAGLRRFVSTCARLVGMAPARVADLVLVVNEVASNSVVHGGGSGLARVWVDDGSIVFEVSDGGHVAEPLAGRRRPTALDEGGRGLWMANQLCDLVEMRTSPVSGTIVRLTMRRT